MYIFGYRFIADVPVTSTAISIAKCSTNWNSVTIASCVNNHQSTCKLDIYQRKRTECTSFQSLNIYPRFVSFCHEKKIQNQYRYTNANVMNHGVLPQNLEQQIQVKQQPTIQTNQLPPNAHFQAIQTQSPCQHEQELTAVNNVSQQPQTIQPQTQNNISSNNNNNNNLCTGAQDQSNGTPAPLKSKKVIDKSRRERKTITRQASTPNTNTAMQQLAVNTQSPLVNFQFISQISTLKNAE